MSPGSKTRKPVTNIAASVRARLLNITRENNRDCNRIMIQYAQERLLYRAIRLQIVKLVTAVAFTVVISRPAFSQDAYEISVYGAETEPPGAVDLQLHSNYTFTGITTVSDDVMPTDRSTHQTLEVTYGFTPWFEVGGYIFTRTLAGSGWLLTGGHIRPRVGIPQKWGWPAGVGLSLEVGPQRGSTATSWTIEIRPIVDRQMGPLYVSFNPVADLVLDGPGKEEAPDFSPAFIVSCRVSDAASVGLEYYGTFGPIGGFSAPRDQQHQIFPAVDLEFPSGWDLNFGVGIGFTPATDHVVAKMILGKRFGAGSD